MEWLSITIIIVLSIIVITLGYACYNLIKKLETQEEWNNEIKEEANQLHARLKEVDDKNLFERDDDVGFVFSEVVRIAKEFNDKLST